MPHACLVSKSLPKLDTIAGLFQNQDVIVLEINCYDKGIRENLEVKFKNKVKNIRFIYGDKDLILSQGISSFPDYHIILPDRQIVKINGNVDKVKEILETIIKSD